MKLSLIKKTSKITTRNIFELVNETNGSIFFFEQTIDEDGKIFDTRLFDVDGDEIFDDTLLSEIDSFLNKFGR